MARSTHSNTGGLPSATGMFRGLMRPELLLVAVFAAIAGAFWIARAGQSMILSRKWVPLSRIML